MTATNEIPPELCNVFDGERLESKIGVTSVLATASLAGQPHLALLSAGEVLTLSATRLNLALHANSGSSQALRENGQALLLVCLQGAVHKVSIYAHEVGMEEVMGVQTAYFRGESRECRKDEAPYARLVSGITFELLDRAETIAMWRSKLRGLDNV